MPRKSIFQQILDEEARLKQVGHAQYVAEGMASIGEVTEALEVIRAHGNRIEVQSHGMGELEVMDNMETTLSEELDESARRHRLGLIHL